MSYRVRFLILLGVVLVQGVGLMQSLRWERQELALVKEAIQYRDEAVR